MQLNEIENRISDKQQKEKALELQCPLLLLDLDLDQPLATLDQPLWKKVELGMKVDMTNVEIQTILNAQNVGTKLHLEHGTSVSTGKDWCGRKIRSPWQRSGTI
jgi:hypothetical protein